MTTGWRCPNCGACYSPFVQQCFNCRGAVQTTDRTSPPSGAWGGRCGNCGEPMTLNHRCVVSGAQGEGR